MEMGCWYTQGHEETSTKDIGVLGVPGDIRGHHFIDIEVLVYLGTPKVKTRGEHSSTQDTSEHSLGHGMGMGMHVLPWCVAWTLVACASWAPLSLSI